MVTIMGPETADKEVSLIEGLRYCRRFLRDFYRGNGFNGGFTAVRDFGEIHLSVGNAPHTLVVFPPENISTVIRSLRDLEAELSGR